MKNIEELNDIDELIIDYITGQLTPDKFNYLNLWTAESKENLLHFRELQEIWYASSSKKEEMFDKSLAYSRFQYRVKEANLSSKEIPIKRFYTSKKFLQLAAAVAVILVLSTTYLLKGFSFSENSKDEFYSITVPYGAKSQITLPDNTKVLLNSGTTIKYSYIARDKVRRLVLTGEAYFEVAKMKGVPFIVETDRLDIKVLGTKFNVVSYNEDSQINVTLIEGSIALKTDNDVNKSFLLTPNNCATFDKSSNKLEIKNVDGSLSKQWSQGVITFEAERLEQIAHRLEREYNVKIEIIDTSITNSHFYGAFNKSQSIKEILDIITLNDKLHYRMKGNIIQVFANEKKLK